MAIAKAKTLNEVERLNQMLKTGVIPGKELKKLRGKYGWKLSQKILYLKRNQYMYMHREIGIKDILVNLYQ